MNDPATRLLPYSVSMDAEEPVRFPLHMQPSFRETATKEQALGSPIRWRMENDVLMQGVIVDWTDEADGSVTLTVEGAAPQD